MLLDPPAEGAWNMAVDEAMLEQYARHPDAPAPTLRLYAWSPAAVSLGRGQSASAAHDAEFLRGEGIDLVRRPTGGGAVLHEHERTYAVVGHLRREPFPGGVVDTYRRVAQALVRALALLGIEARAQGRTEDMPRRSAVHCFSRASVHEITVGSHKVVGAAQLRRRGAFLQHGSILLRALPERAARAIGSREAQAAFAGLESLLGTPLAPARVDEAVVRGFERVFGAEMRPGALDPEETERAQWLRRTRYRNGAWTLGSGSA